MSDCPRLGKWFGGCKFEARYSLSVPTAKFSEMTDIGKALWHSEVAQVLEASKARTYQGDVCIRCGRRVSHGTDGT